MISVNTAAGTKVLCIDDRPGDLEGTVPHMGGLKEGRIYTVLRMNLLSSGVVTVVLVEIDRRKLLWMPWPESGFYRSRFRYLDLPSVITDILNAQPVKGSELV